MLAWNNQLHLAPIDVSGNLNVLDIGTGTGIWALQFAEQNPEFQVIGTDLTMTRRS
jgi:methylase of polypeptide subunit release factors